MTRSSSIPAGLAQRARIVLLAAAGWANAEIARRIGTSWPTVADWRARYDVGGVAALGDAPRNGRPPRFDEVEIVVATLSDEGRPPEHLGVTHWSARLLGAHLGISFATVAPDLAQVGPAAVAGSDLQVLHRPRTRREDPRRGRALPAPAGEGRRALRR